MNKFPYKWTLRDAVFTKDKGKVFSCFACGGGSTMGYKLAGFDVIGCNEIDKRMNETYMKNHNPRFNFLCDIRELVASEDLPEELYHLDILDGSPPCSSFSMAGNREKDWGKEKFFREGQKAQVLDTLFFDFIDLAKKLQPKVVVAENVKGIILGDAIGYVRRIYNEFDKAGYYCQHFLVNANKMGVPQKRERVFFLCVRKDLAEPHLIPIDLFTSAWPINMEFDEHPILWREINNGKNDRPLSEAKLKLWHLRQYGDIDLSCSCARDGQNANKFFNCKYLYDHKSPNTVTGNDQCIVYHEGRYRNSEEIILCSSFPTDYDFNGQPVDYMCGMSVPPVMMAQVASRVHEYWLSKLK